MTAPTSLREHPRDVLDEPAAGDVSERLDAAGGERRLQHGQVVAVRFEQGIAERPIEAERGDVHRHPCEQLAQQ